MDTTWNSIYTQKQQLNKYPYTEVVSFFHRNKLAFDNALIHALDVGCGSGVHSQFLADHGAKVTAIDFSPAAIKEAQIMFGHNNISYEVADFSDFKHHDTPFHLVVDRLSTTHSTPDIARKFYQDLKDRLVPGALGLWQGFTWDNSGRDMGKQQPNGSFNNFSGGVFEHLGNTAFFKEDDLSEIFHGYTQKKLRRLSDRDMATGYEHSYWQMEWMYD